MKLFLLISSLAGGKGGSERVAVDVGDQMVERGHTVHMAYVDKGPPAYDSRKEVILFPYTDLNVLGEEVRAVNPDVFFVFYFNRQLINYYRIVHGTDIPFGMQECTNPERMCVNNWGGVKRDPVLSAWEREIVASGAARIRLTMPNYANSFPPYLRQSIRTYPNPCFPQEVLACPCGAPAGRKQILNVNGFKANKNLIALVQAFARLAPEFPDWDLKIIGKTPEPDEPHSAEILQLIEGNGLRDRVLIHGPVDNVFAHYAEANIHVLSSLSEGCPTVVLEAMTVGLPSVGYEDCPGTNELIEDEANGLLAACDDRVGGLENVLRRLFSSPELRDRLGAKALEDSKDFQVDKIYQKWERLFFEASEYRGDPARLYREQASIDPEMALHARRMREKILQ